MNRFTWFGLVSSGLAILVVAGCGGSAKTPTVASSDGGTETGGSPDSGPNDGGSNGSDSADSNPKLVKSIKRYSLAELKAKPGDYMPPLDNGRIEIAPPEGWDWKRPGSPYLTGFCEKGGSINNLPRILIKAEDNSFAGFENVTEENVVDFAIAVAQQLGDEKLLAPVEPMVLGDIACARYVKLGRMNNAAVGEQVTLTVANGRLYTVRLEAIEHQFQTYRDQGYAVVAGLKIIKSGETPATESVESTPAEPSPAPSDN